MAYAMNVSAKQQEYILRLPLSDEAKNVIRKYIKSVITNVSDEYRNDPARRPRPDSPYFQMRLNFQDMWGDLKYHIVDFVVNDAGAKFGVLDLVWVDHQEAIASSA